MHATRGAIAAGGCQCCLRSPVLKELKTQFNEKAEVIDTVVVGAGHAGLALSYYLTRNGTEHIVLERGNVAERWRTERWDSLVFQFPNWSLQLPGRAYPGSDPDGYASKGRVHPFS